MGVKTDHQELCRPLSLSILDQAPLWLVATGVNSRWLVGNYDGSHTDSLTLAIAARLVGVTHRVWGIPSFPPAARIDDQSLPRGEGCSFLTYRGGNCAHR